MSIAKWRNGLAVRLPKALGDNLGPRAGDGVQIAAKGPGELVVGRDPRRQRAVETMRRRAWAPPHGYIFDRNAANERQRTP